MNDTTEDTVVYFMAIREHDVVKIGFCKKDKLNARIKTCQTYNSGKVELLGYLMWSTRIMGCMYERYFHCTFAEHHVNGEWFRLSEIETSINLFLAIQGRPPTEDSAKLADGMRNNTKVRELLSRTHFDLIANLNDGATKLKDKGLSGHHRAVKFFELIKKHRSKESNGSNSQSI